MSHAPTLKDAVRQKLDDHFALKGDMDWSSVGGGSINQTYRLRSLHHTVFCKINSASKFPHLFRTESLGLHLIKEQGLVKVPDVIACFETGGYQVLLLEWINSGERTEGFWRKFGEQLARLHQVSHPVFGLGEDNYMGSVPQSNQPATDWIRFFTERRLQPLLDKCAAKQLISVKHRRQFENLYRHLPQIFDTTQKPALVHGDLWSGNYMCNHASEPVLIDPAVYFGHPAVDLAMTTLFGGFRSPFYEAYNYYAPFPPNHGEQWEICNLYPLLVHLYLFGNTYMPPIEQTLQKF